MVLDHEFALFDIGEDGRVIKRGLIMSRAIAFSNADFVRYIVASTQYRYYDIFYGFVWGFGYIFLFILYLPFMTHPTTLALGLPIMTLALWGIRWWRHRLIMSNTEDGPETVTARPLGFFVFLRRRFLLQNPDYIDPLTVSGTTIPTAFPKFIPIFMLVITPIAIPVMVHQWLKIFSDVGWFDLESIFERIWGNAAAHGIAAMFFFSSGMTIFHFYRKAVLNQFWKDGYKASAVIDNYDSLRDIYLKTLNTVKIKSIMGSMQQRITDWLMERFMPIVITIAIVAIVALNTYHFVLK